MSLCVLWKLNPYRSKSACAVKYVWYRVVLWCSAWTFPYDKEYFGKDTRWTPPMRLLSVYNVQQIFGGTFWIQSGNGFRLIGIKSYPPVFQRDLVWHAIFSKKPPRLSISSVLLCIWGEQSKTLKAGFYFKSNRLSWERFHPKIWICNEVRHIKAAGENSAVA